MCTCWVSVSDAYVRIRLCGLHRETRGIDRLEHIAGLLLPARPLGRLEQVADVGRISTWREREPGLLGGAA